jgi:hypothetical protein
VSDTPAHIVIKDRQIRAVDTVCHRCLSQAHIGQYDNPAYTDQKLAEWVARHLHEDQP